jgi:hypothetical protein
MRKLMMLLTLTLSYIAVAGAVRADGPPECNVCPWVR